MEETRILGIQIHDRQKEAGVVQGILSRYGCSIRTRLGLHEAYTDKCSPSGLILLELTGEMKDKEKLEDELSKTPGVTVKKMIF